MRNGALTLGLALLITGCGAGSEEAVDEVAGELATTTAGNVNCGGPTVGGTLINGLMTATFVADEGFTGGSTISHPEVAINMSKVSSSYPPPMFQTGRVGTAGFSYTFGPFAPNWGATVRLLFAETYFKTTGSRQFNVSINSAPVLTNFDIVQASGGKGVAIEKSFGATADANGFIKIQFSPIANKNQPLVSGIAVNPLKTSM